jgi:hypothetical protein
VCARATRWLQHEHEQQRQPQRHSSNGTAQHGTPWWCSPLQQTPIAAPAGRRQQQVDLRRGVTGPTPSGSRRR